MTKNALKKIKIFLAVGIVYLLTAQSAFAQFSQYDNVYFPRIMGVFCDVILFVILMVGIGFAVIHHIKQGDRQRLALEPSKPISLILSAAATLCLLITLVMPFVFYIFFSKGDGYWGFDWFSGFNYEGWRAFIPIIAFAATTTARIIPPLAPYRQLTDRIAFVAFVALLVQSMVSWFIWLIWQVFYDDYIILRLPNIGVIFAIAAPILLFIAGSKEKR